MLLRAHRSGFLIILACCCFDTVSFFTYEIKKNTIVNIAFVYHVHHKSAGKMLIIYTFLFVCVFYFKDEKNTSAILCTKSSKKLNQKKQKNRKKLYRNSFEHFVIYFSSQLQGIETHSSTLNMFHKSVTKRQTSHRFHLSRICTWNYFAFL